MKFLTKLITLLVIAITATQSAYGIFGIGSKPQMDGSLPAARIEPQQSYRGGDVTASVRAYYCNLVGQAGRPAIMKEKATTKEFFSWLCGTDYQMYFNHPNVSDYLGTKIAPSGKTKGTDIVVTRADLKRYCGQLNITGNMNAKLSTVYNKFCDRDLLNQGSKKAVNKDPGVQAPSAPVAQKDTPKPNTSHATKNQPEAVAKRADRAAKKARSDMAKKAPANKQRVKLTKKQIDERKNSPEAKAIRAKRAAAKQASEKAAQKARIDLKNKSKEAYKQDIHDEFVADVEEDEDEYAENEGEEDGDYEEPTEEETAAAEEEEFDYEDGDFVDEEE